MSEIEIKEETAPQDNIFVLKKPLIDGDTTYTELNIDIDSLSAKDIIQAEKDVLKIISEQERALMMVKPTSLPYQLAIAARASGIPIELTLGLNGKDAMRIGARVQNFLFSQ